MTTHRLEEIIEFHRIIGIIVVHYSHSIPFDSMLIKKFYASHHLHKRRKPLLIVAILVVKLLRSINRHSHQPVVFLEELAPLISEQCTVSLYAVVNSSSLCILLLQFHCPLIEAERTHQRFSSVPGKEYLRHSLRADILFDETLQKFVTHHILGRILI